jgi:two-component system response regulator FlrC
MLFGHEKGAFTGAHREQKGLFEQAHGGTLFLDEIGEMPMHLQSKLLRVLQERQLTRLGGQSVIQLNVRIVAATNKDLKAAIAAREFREDLYYRIATFRMRLLPLAERPGDIIPLALQCLLQHDKKPWQLHPQAQAQLLRYPWPGNVRELENVMRRAMVLCSDHLITPAHLMFDDWLTTGTASPTPTAMPVSVLAPVLAPASAPMPASAVEAFMQATTQHLDTPNLVPSNLPDQSSEPQPTDLHSAVRMNEHQVIMATLAATPSKTEAAKRLGISPRTLRYKLAQLREHGLGMASAAC